MVEERKGAALPEERKGDAELEAPQDDALLQMMEAMESLQARMKSIRGDF